TVSAANRAVPKCSRSANTFNSAVFQFWAENRSTKKSAVGAGRPASATACATEAQLNHPEAVRSAICTSRNDATLSSAPPGRHVGGVENLLVQALQLSRLHDLSQSIEGIRACQRTCHRTELAHRNIQFEDRDDLPVICGAA